MKFYASNLQMATLLATIVLIRDQNQCHGLRHPPSYVHLVTATTSHASSPIPSKIRRDTCRKNTVRTRLYDTDDVDEWDDDMASQAILSGQGDFFSFLSMMPRGGCDDTLNNNNNNNNNNIINDSNNSISIINSFNNSIINSMQKIATCDVSAMHPTKMLQSIKNGFAHRIEADPSFVSKSLLEIMLAAITQYMAEVSRRGKDRIMPEFDFVLAGVLTAVCGKYYSMWRVARTVNVHEKSSKMIIESNAINPTASTTSMNSWRDKVPTNAFQPTLFDGYTTPSLSSRILAFLLPMPQLFRAGFIASTIGYGLTSMLIRARALLVPQYVVATEAVPVVLAAVYTGLFMAFVSNIRYQILQGVVEPFLVQRGQRYPTLFGKLAVLLVRYANGVLGSWMAIGGMRAVGLQKLK